jgi:hypothetical protein
MRLIFFLVVLCALSIPSVAQIVTCMERHDTIYVGASSRWFVKQTGRFYYAAGVPEDSLVLSEISRIAGRAASIDGLADSSIAYMRLRYTGLFGEILAKDADFFNRRIMHDQPNVTLGELCFFGIEGGRAKLVQVFVFMNKGKKHPVVISSSRQDSPGALITWKAGRPYPGIWGNYGLSRVGELKQEIALFSMKNPKHFDEPIDVLVLTKKGGVWSRQ